MTLLETYLTLISEDFSISDIEFAIEQNQLLSFYYKGDKTVNAGYRYAEIYALGVSKAGNKVIRAYQTRGVTDTFKPDWKLFRFDKMRDVEFVGNFYVARKGFNKNGDNSMARVDKIADIL